jgi:hypothetical protein
MPTKSWTGPEEGAALKTRIHRLPRRVWAVSPTSLLIDVSSYMVINILPLFLANVLGVRTSVTGLIEGVAEAVASVLKLFSGSRSWGTASQRSSSRSSTSPQMGGGGRRAQVRPRREGHSYRTARRARGQLRR